LGLSIRLLALCRGSPPHRTVGTVRDWNDWVIFRPSLLKKTVSMKFSKKKRIDEFPRKTVYEWIYTHTQKRVYKL
jgi:hypothetical protein